MGLLQIVGAKRNHLVPQGSIRSVSLRMFPPLRPHPSLHRPKHGNAETVDLMMEFLDVAGLKKLGRVLAKLAGQIRLTQMRSIGKGRQFG